MKQTKLEALKTCRELWQVEAEHGTGDKEKMFSLAGLDIADFDSGCPACEYYIAYSPDGIVTFCASTCIITWPGGGCMSDLSPYKQWVYHGKSTKNRKKYAAKIVVLCEEAIKKENQRSPAQAGQGETK